MSERRIIIENQSSHDDRYAVEAVAAMLRQGIMMADGSGYAPVRMRDGTLVSTFRNKRSDRFVVLDGDPPD